MLKKKTFIKGSKKIKKIKKGIDNSLQSSL